MAAAATPMPLTEALLVILLRVGRSEHYAAVQPALGTHQGTMLLPCVLQWRLAVEEEIDLPLALADQGRRTQLHQPLP